MQLARIKLWDYRNYERLDAEFPPGIIVLAGANGAGKSNLLEAVHYLSYLRSFRSARDREIIRFDKTYAAIEAKLLDDAGRPFDVRLVLKGGQRHLRLNGNDVTRFQDFVGRLHSQFFFPGNLALLTGDPVLRREVLDLELLRLKPQLVPVYNSYRNALRERNKVLKLLYPRPGERRADDGQLAQALGVFTQQLVGAGAQVMRERRGLVKVLDELFAPLYSSLAPPKGESVNLAYHSLVELEPDDAVAQNFRQRLDAAAETEGQLRYTTAGPHRDDLCFVLDDKRDLRRFGSQGQLRSAALSFRLALCALSGRRLSDNPILLLDDALSEMDDGRKQRLLEICRKHRQVFITSASEREVDLIAPLAKMIYDISHGQLDQRGFPDTD